MRKKEGGGGGICQTSFKVRLDECSVRISYSVHIESQFGYVGNDRMNNNIYTIKTSSYNSYYLYYDNDYISRLNRYRSVEVDEAINNTIQTIFENSTSECKLHTLRVVIQDKSHTELSERNQILINSSREIMIDLTASWPMTAHTKSNNIPLLKIPQTLFLPFHYGTQDSQYQLPKTRWQIVNWG